MKHTIYIVIYKVQKLEKAHELQKKISRAGQEGDERERAMAGPIAQQEKPEKERKDSLHSKLQKLDMKVQGLSESNPMST